MKRVDHAIFSWLKNKLDLATKDSSECKVFGNDIENFLVK